MIKKTPLILLLTCIILWIIGLVIFGYSINHLTSNYTEKTDAIIALTGGRNRISEAVKLLNKKLSNRLFISGVASGVNLKNILQTQNLHPTPASTIELGYSAEDTIGNAQETAEWVKKNNIKSLRLVTSNYHLNRAIIEFKHFMPQVKIIAHPAYSERIENKWWTSWQTFSLIGKEYNKLIYAFIKYKLHM